VSPLLQRAFAGLRGNDPEEFAEAVGLAVSFFEAGRVPAAALGHPEAADMPATAEELQALQHELVRLVREDPRRPGAGAVIFALGKRDDRGLVGVLADGLRAHLDGDAEALYQALIALENLGEEVPWVTDVQSIRAAAENRRTAEEYLRRAGG
jgi:hypothetical protein